MAKETVGYYQSNIRTSRNEDSVYAMTYANQQLLIDKLQQENQKLKKQLENCYCNRTDCSSRIKDSKQYDSLVQKTEKQQKELIEYLESEIDTITQQKETFAELDAGQGVYLMTLAIVLEKYKEIIGDK